jgi:hypothetical protein
MRYLKDKTGFIYEWNEILAENPDCTEITEQEAYPEKFVPKAQKNRKSGLALATNDLPEEPTYTNQDVNLEASKGLM